MLRCEDNSVSMSYPQNAIRDSELLFELITALCCYEKATGIVLINTRCFTQLFAPVCLCFIGVQHAPVGR